MLLYKTTYAVDQSEDGTAFKHFAKWGGSQTEASKHRADGKAAGCDKKPTTQTVEVPTNKAGLLEWLNANVTA